MQRKEVLYVKGNPVITVGGRIPVIVGEEALCDSVSKGTLQVGMPKGA